MKYFTIYKDNTVRAFENEDDAYVIIRQHNESWILRIVTDLSDNLPTFTMARLVEIWNSFPVRSVTRFKDRAAGAKRIWDYINAHIEVEAHEEKKEAGTPNAGSKLDRAIGMMRQPEGVTLQQLMDAFGWQKHTVRGFVAGTLARKGFRAESFKTTAGERAYRLAAQ